MLTIVLRLQRVHRYKFCFVVAFWKCDLMPEVFSLLGCIACDQNSLCKLCNFKIGLITTRLFFAENNVNLLIKS